MMYAYSDSTSWTPVTDGKHVWFFNCSGEMGCWDFHRQAGLAAKVSRARASRLTSSMSRSCSATRSSHVEPLAGGSSYRTARTARSGIICGVSTRTRGKTLWIAEDGTTYYCTAVAGSGRDGTPGLYSHGRGGPHDVPERPIGLSLSSLEANRPGRQNDLWNGESPCRSRAPRGWNHLPGALHDALGPEVRLLVPNAPEESHLVFDAGTGRPLLKTQSLVKNVDFRQWDPAASVHRHNERQYRDMKDFSPRVPLKQGEVLHVFPNWHANIVGWTATTTSSLLPDIAGTDMRRPALSGPSHCIGRVNVETGKVEYLEVPVSVARKPGQPDRLSTTRRSIRRRTITRAETSRRRIDRAQTAGRSGVLRQPDLRRRQDLHGHDARNYVCHRRPNAKALDEKALLSVNDLGPSGRDVEPELAQLRERPALPPQPERGRLHRQGPYSHAQ